MKTIVLAVTVAAAAAAAQAQSPAGEIRITTWGAPQAERAPPPIQPPRSSPDYAISPPAPYRGPRPPGVKLRRVALEGYLVPVDGTALRLADSGATLNFAGEPAVGPVSEGRYLEIVSIPVRHAVTGVLRQDVHSGGLFAKRSVPAGSRVYAVAGARLNGEQAQRIWCAPIGVHRKARTDWDAVCFPSVKTGDVRFVHLEDDGLLSTFMPVRDRPGAAPVDVEERQVEPFGPMRLAYVFGGWSADTANIGVRAVWDGGSTPVGDFSIPRARDGSARLTALQGEFVLRPSQSDPKAVVFETARAPSTPGAWPFEN